MKHTKKFKSRSEYEAAKKTLKVIEAHDPFMILIVDDGVLSTRKSTSDESSSDFAADGIETGLVVLTPLNMEAGLAYLKKYNVVQVFNHLGSVAVEIPEDTSFEDLWLDCMSTGLFSTIVKDEIIAQKISSPVSNDPSVGTQWFISQSSDKDLDVEEAWALMPAGASGHVAVIDGHGYDMAHEDLVGQLVLPFDAVTGSTDVTPISPYEKHGTPCAGLIAAKTNNLIGVAGLGGNFLKVMPIRIGYNPTSSGSFYTSDSIMAAAVNRAISNPDCVAISMSFGSTSFRTAFNNALQAAMTTGRGGKGIAVFASTGNDGASTWTNYPASFPNVIKVGASTSSDTRSSFSNHGPNVTLSAPGSATYTTDFTGTSGYNAASYTSFSGTSAACPVAAAVGAMAIIANPAMTLAQLNSCFATVGCDKVGGYLYDSVTGKSFELGYGRVNMKSCVQYALELGGTPPPPPPPPAQKHNFTIAVTCTPTAVEGATIAATATLSTDKPALEAFSSQIQYRWSTDAVWNTATDILLTSDILSVGGGVASAQRTFNVTVPTGVGTRYLLAKCDSNNAYTESNENDNISAAQVTVTSSTPPPPPPPPPTGGLDASLEVLSYSFTNATTLQVKMRVKNTGSVNITKYTATYGLVGGSMKNLGIMMGSPIRPGFTGGLTVNVTIGPAAAQFKCTIVTVNDIADVNPANNVVILQVPAH